jgi:hypothetical protein
LKQASETVQTVGRHARPFEKFPCVPELLQMVQKQPSVRDSFGVLSLGFGGGSLNAVHSVLGMRETRKGLYPSSTRLICISVKGNNKG